MTVQHHSQFSVGDRVQVSDGTKQPPKHHSKKLGSWKGRNYTGKVEEVAEPRDYSPNGGLTLSNDEYRDTGICSFHFSMDLGGRLTVEKLAQETAAA